MIPFPFQAGQAGLSFQPVAAGGSGLQYVGGASATGNSADYSVDVTALTGGIGSAAAAGDLVLVVTGAASLSDLDVGVTTAGYTELLDLYSNNSRDANVAVAWKIMGGSPDTSVAVKGSGDAAYGAATVVQVWRGAHQTTPIDVTSQTSTGSGSSTVDSPSITPVTSGAVVITCGSCASSTSQSSASAPSGYGNSLVAAVQPATSACTTVVASKAWTSGAENPGAWGSMSAGASGATCSASIAIRPA